MTDRDEAVRTDVATYDDGAADLGGLPARRWTHARRPGGPAVNRVRCLLVALAGAGTAGVVLVACGGAEGTVVAKADQGVYDYGCQAAGTVTGPVAAPAWGACSAPRCWRLVVRDNGGDTSEPCVSREEYDRTPVGAFWHGRTDG